MCKRIQRLLVSLCTFVTFVFAADVTLTLQFNGNLDYDSTADIYGLQFNHDGCASGAGGGDAVVQPEHPAVDVDMADVQQAPQLPEDLEHCKV